MTYKDMLSLISEVFAYDMGETTGFPFDKTTMMLTPGDCVIPADLEENVKQLHQFLYGSESYTPSATVQEYSAKITSLTGVGAGDGTQ
jgi:hypothetical protein